MTVTRRSLDTMWSRHNAAWRDPAQVASQWEGAAHDPRLLHGRATGRFWEALAASGITLLVTREYEHVVMALRPAGRGGRVSYFPLPHPSGLVVDRVRRRVHVASTRNPNQVFEFAPVTGERRPSADGPDPQRPLVPVGTRVYPGSLYLHDLAWVGGQLLANAVGENAVVRLDDSTDPPRVWWPRCIDTRKGPVFDRNHLQMNSIAAGPDLARSFFSASTDVMTRRRPGHRNFPVDGRGVIFSGQTREPIVRGLTRPHSARLHRRRLWVANSGYGELGIAADGRFEPVGRLPGWTRGLCFSGDLAFVGTSRVIPRFQAYAPGVDAAKAVCGVHAVDIANGRVLGSFVWPGGNQIFAVDWMPGGMSSGFPFAVGRRIGSRERRLFSGFTAR